MWSGVAMCLLEHYNTLHSFGLTLAAFGPAVSPDVLWHEHRSAKSIICNLCYIYVQKVCEVQLGFCATSFWLYVQVAISQFSAHWSTLTEVCQASWTASTPKPSCAMGCVELVQQRPAVLSMARSPQLQTLWDDMRGKRCWILLDNSYNELA